MSQNRYTENIITGIRYVRENWGSPFIVAFMLFLLSATVPLSMTLYHLADSIAVIAFYALVVGAILQLVCLLKYSKELAGAEAV
jgi:hypothetical protein